MKLDTDIFSSYQLTMRFDDDTLHTAQTLYTKYTTKQTKELVLL